MDHLKGQKSALLKKKIPSQNQWEDSLSPQEEELTERKWVHLLSNVAMTYDPLGREGVVCLCVCRWGATRGQEKDGERETEGEREAKKENSSICCWSLVKKGHRVQFQWFVVTIVNLFFCWQTDRTDMDGHSCLVFILHL